MGCFVIHKLYRLLDSVAPRYEDWLDKKESGEGDHHGLKQNFGASREQRRIDQAG